MQARACGGRSPRPRAGKLPSQASSASVSFVSSSRSRSSSSSRGTAPACRSGTVGHPQEERCGCPRPARSPRATRCPGAIARPRGCNDAGVRTRYGCGARACRSRSSASASSSSWTSPSIGTWSPAAPTLASKPVSSLTASLIRAASAGSTVVTRRSFVLAPGPASRPLGGAHREALARRSASRAGAARRGRAPRAPRGHGPRSARCRPTIASTSSGSSSRRMRFETVGFDRPTRSATSPSESPNSSISTAYARASSIGREVFARDVLDEAEQERVAVVRFAHDCRHASRARLRVRRASGARRRSARSRPRAAGRTTTGWIRPCALIDSARPLPASPSKRLRGCFGFGWISSTARCASSGVAPPIRTSKPRPRPAS